MSPAAYLHMQALRRRRAVMQARRADADLRRAIGDARGAAAEHRLRKSLGMRVQATDEAIADLLRALGDFDPLDVQGRPRG